MALTDKDKKGYLMMAGAAAIVVAIFAAKLAVGNKPKAGPDGCISPTVAETVVVLDHSETLSDQTRNEITARAMAHVRDHVATNERVTVFYVSEVSKKSLVPAFSRCKPPQEGNRTYEDAKGVAKAYQRTFIEPLEGVLKAAPSNAKESPIAQALIDISLSQYLRGKRNTLLVYSDMLEHTPKFSLYSCVDLQKSVALFRQARKGAQERPKFSQTSVVLNMIPRLDISKSTLKCRDEVWGEPPRVLRRLRPLRGWSHEESNQVFAGGPGEGCPDGRGVAGPARLAVGGHRVHRGQDRLHGRDAATLGSPA